GSAIGAVAVSAELGLVATASGGDIRLWDEMALEFEGGVLGHHADILKLLFLPGTPLLLAGDAAGAVAVWALRFVGKTAARECGEDSQLASHDGSTSSPAFGSTYSAVPAAAAAAIPADVPGVVADSGARTRAVRHR
ncbi:unnamed protein product, partial [Phaeothamnion confervicola]